MTLPAQVLDLVNWKITLPVGKKNSPTEVKQPALATFSDATYFHVGTDGGVVFRAPVNGVTTSGSANPRSELRELRPGGDWSSTDGQVHSMVWEMAFTHLPNARTDGGTAGVVGGQVHDADNDWCVFRLEGTHLWITNGNNTHFKLADADYELGTRFTGMFVIEDGVIEAYYNGLLIAAIPARFSNAYFKLGAYTQANSSDSKPATAADYGETVVYRVDVAHAAVAPDPPATPPVVVPPPVPVSPVVMVMRHAEGGSNAHTLDADGLARAAAIPSLFLPVLKAGLYTPTAIYASEGKTKSLRPLQTAQPLAQALGELVVTSYAASSAKTLGKFLAKVKSGVHCCFWAHEDIAALTKALGKSTPKAPTSWPDDRYDVCLVFVGDGNGNWSLTQVFQMLETGDVEVPIP